MPRTIGIVVFPGVEELDFVGPWEIFTMTAALAPDSCTVFAASESGEEVSAPRACVCDPTRPFANVSLPVTVAAR